MTGEPTLQAPLGAVREVGFQEDAPPIGNLPIESIWKINRTMKEAGYRLSIVNDTITIMENSTPPPSEVSPCKFSTFSRRLIPNQPSALCTLTQNTLDIYSRGNFGSKVHEGLYEGKKRCAIKRISDGKERAEREVDILRDIASPHVISYFMSEVNGRSTLIYMEWAQHNLMSFYKERRGGSDWRLNQDICSQIIAGVQGLHARQIAHGDLTPENVLVTLAGEDANARPIIKLGDFSCSCKRSNPLDVVELRSSIVWERDSYAPEIFTRDSSEFNFENHIKADVYSLGCLLGFVMTGGQHERSGSLHDYLHELDTHTKGHRGPVEYEVSLMILFRDIMLAMTAENPEHRPSVECVAKHLALCPQSKRVKFLVDLSNWLKLRESAFKSPGDAYKNFTNRISKAKKSAAAAAAAAAANTTVGTNADDSELASNVFEDLKRFSYNICRGTANWGSLLPQKILDYMQDRRIKKQYNFNCPVDLIRLLRNMSSHIFEIPQDTRALLSGNTEEDIERFFACHYPFLLPTVYKLIQYHTKSFVTQETLKTYYHENEIIDYRRFGLLEPEERARSLSDCVIK